VNHREEKIAEKAKKIRLAVFDVDGVFTNGQLYFTETHEYKMFHVHDGLGIKMLLESGIHVGIISGHTSPLVATRLTSLGIDPTAILLGSTDKLPAFKRLLEKYQLPCEAASYMGDDLPDLPVIRQAGLGISVPNGAKWVQEQASWITQKAGGDGAVREVCELILRAQNRLEHYIEL
jgi:3-deoxy-D-manno-octulosonate 8-phosphate phosphatase (KDO 8-P phosphatase)